VSVDIAANVGDIWKLAYWSSFDVLSTEDSEVTADTLAVDEAVSHIAW